jgi:hypothetical protein
VVKRKPAVQKVVDEVHQVRCKSGSHGVIRIEVWQDERGKIRKYNLAFVHHGLCQVDNGRVLGYDNAHGYHERHSMGTAYRVERFASFEQTQTEFLDEVQLLREES